MITLAAAAAISRDKINSLQPGFAERVRGWYTRMCEADITPYIYEGFRSRERQDELYRLGRSMPGRVVTNAKGGQSFHNFGLAIDWVPLVHAPKALGMYEADWDGDEAYATGQTIAEQFKLRWLSWESPHLEDGTYTDYHAIPYESHIPR